MLRKMFQTDAEGWSSSTCSVPRASQNIPEHPRASPSILQHPTAPTASHSIPEHPRAFYNILQPPLNPTASQSIPAIVWIAALPPPPPKLSLPFPCPCASPPSPAIPKVGFEIQGSGGRNGAGSGVREAHRGGISPLQSFASMNQHESELLPGVGELSWAREGQRGRVGTQEGVPHPTAMDSTAPLS